jgi:hypothetical protein
MRPPTSTGLYWSIRGKVLCNAHAGDVSDDSWTSERWQPLPFSAQGVHGLRYQCVSCGGRAISHQRRATLPAALESSGS